MEPRDAWKWWGRADTPLALYPAEGSLLIPLYYHATGDRSIAAWSRAETKVWIVVDAATNSPYG